MKEDDLLASFESPRGRLTTHEKLLFEGQYSGSCGAAVVVRNCVVRKLHEDGSAVRTVERGTLVLVWSSHDEVRFSIVSDTMQVDMDCLLCKIGDLVRVPDNVWGALFPLKPESRIALATDRVISRLATVKIGSTVELLTTANEPIAYATVVYKNEVPGLKIGIYYGVKLLGAPNTHYDVIRLVSVLPRDSKVFPTGCDAIVTLQQIRPTDLDIAESPSIGLPRRDSNEMQTFRSTFVLDLDDGQKTMPKSASHQNLRSSDEAISRRHASRSLDLTAQTSKARNGNVVKHAMSNLELPPHLTKHAASRSLDLPPSTSRRLMRGRACASLDSDSPVAKNDVDNGPDDNVDDELGIGSLVELTLRGQPHYGVIRWVGRLPDGPTRRLAGVEMEEELDVDEDVDTRGLFQCPPYKALFIPLSHCRRDSRFQETTRRRAAPSLNMFGQIDCPVVEGTIPPISEELHNICGKNRGIQGHHNSCYLDATLFAMFAFTSVFDSLLYRPPTKVDVPQYEEVQRVLRDEIVNPLRKNLYVRADRVMKLRTLLERLSSVTGLTSEEKDPEEFLNSLLAQILKAEPFLQLSSGQEAFHYQLFVEKDERLSVPSVQQLLEQSFLASDIKLKQLPPCLIVQMPRFGKAFKMYPRILPPTVLDVTDVIENSPRQCTVCGKLAELECRECYLAGLEGGSFCARCLETAHSHPSRSRHIARPLAVPIEFRELQEHCAVPRLAMHLFAVVCIETSHYVAFINTDQGWVFFDSMADRKGEQNGYNIPEIVLCPDLPFWLSEEGARSLEEIHDERQLPDLAKRLLCDAYMCMYQSPDIMMYR